MVSCWGVLFYWCIVVVMIWVRLVSEIWCGCVMMGFRLSVVCSLLVVVCIWVRVW